MQLTFDAHADLVYSTVLTPPSPADTGLTLTVAAGQGVRFPLPPFNASVFAAGAAPAGIASGAEFIRVTSVSTDTFVIQRATEGPNVARSILVGDQIVVAPFAKTFTDIETAINTIYTQQQALIEQNLIQSLKDAYSDIMATESYSSNRQGFEIR